MLEKLVRILPCLVVALASSNAYAQDVPSSEVVMLPCDGKCPVITRQKKISGSNITFPGQGANGQRYLYGDFAEGLVELQFSIQPDGHVGDDISLTRLVGPLEFVDAAKRAVRDWRYEPATVGGQPVAISENLRVVFNLSADVEEGARNSIVQGYQNVTELLKKGKLDEANAQLTEMLKLPRLNFYERGIIIYPLALIEMQRQRYAEVKNLSDLALDFPSERFSRSVYVSLIRLNILASLQLGDLVGAAKSVGLWTKNGFLDASDPLATQVAEAKNKIDALPSYSVSGTIPNAGEADGFRLYLYHRYFTFSNIVGKLERFSLYCREKQSESPISDKAEWSVPKDLSDCAILVRGAPGTTFQVLQFASEPPKQ